MLIKFFSIEFTNIPQLQKTSIIIAGISAKVQTGYLQSTNQRRYQLSLFAWLHNRSMAPKCKGSFTCISFGVFAVVHSPGT
jgi:hypothetical protein